MILSDRDIIEGIERYELITSEFSFQDNQLQSASFDVTLGNTWIVSNSKDKVDKPIYINDVNTFEYTFEKIIADEFIIQPKQFVLATTRECVNLTNDLTAFVEGRSSVGRLGLFVQNAGWVDAGFCGQITLELFNANDVPICLYSGFRIAQLVFAKMTSNCINPYMGKYQGQVEATPSMLYKDFT